MAAKEKVIKVQEELIDCKSSQIEKFQSNVQTTLQSEFKSYSQAVKRNSGDSLTVRKIQNVVKHAVEIVTGGEDRQKNVIIFGLEEKDKECLSKKVNSVMLAIDMKPKFSAERFGRDSPCRPVRVNFSDSSVRYDVLRAAKNLKTTTDHKDVFICPDLSPEERAERKKLVGELKEKVRTNPGTHYFIKGGAVYSRLSESETDESSSEEEICDTLKRESITQSPIHFSH